jgi:hypothetical protein
MTLTRWPKLATAGLASTSRLSTGQIPSIWLRPGAWAGSWNTRSQGLALAAGREWARVGGGPLRSAVRVLNWPFLPD